MESKNPNIFSNQKTETKKKSNKKTQKRKTEEEKTMIMILETNENKDKELFGNIILVNPAPDLERTRIKYSVSRNVNKKFLNIMEFLNQLTPYIINLGITKSAYERGVIKPLNKFVNGRMKTKNKKTDENTHDSHKPVKPSSFKLPRKTKDEFEKLYHKLEEENNDMSQIHYENKQASLIDLAATIRMYINTHNHLKKDKHIYFDDFLKEIFKDKINSLPEINGEKFITQRQIQTLASWLIDKS